jgi:hypothetical protein
MLNYVFWLEWTCIEQVWGFIMKFWETLHIMEIVYFYVLEINMVGGYQC